jgi:hypothetical protein
MPASGGPVINPPAARASSSASRDGLANDVEAFLDSTLLQAQYREVRAQLRVPSVVSCRPIQHPRGFGHETVRPVERRRVAELHERCGVPLQELRQRTLVIWRRCELHQAPRREDRVLTHAARTLVHGAQRHAGQRASSGDDGLQDGD